MMYISNVNDMISLNGLQLIKGVGGELEIEETDAQTDENALVPFYRYDVEYQYHRAPQPARCSLPCN